jgi:hypothetical protein
MGQDKGTSTPVAALDLAKAALWPLLALMMVLYFAAPLRSLLDRLPDVIGRAEQVSAGSLTLRIRASSLPAADRDVADALRALSENELQDLLGISAETEICSPLGAPSPETGRGHMIQLRLLSIQEGDAGCSPNLKLTELGKRVKRFVAALVAAQIR